MSKNNLPTGMGEMRKYSDGELKEMLEESREASKHSRKMGRVMGIVVDHRLQQLQCFQAMQQLATWRRTHDYDRDDSWMHGTLPFIASRIHCEFVVRFARVKGCDLDAW